MYTTYKGDVEAEMAEIVGFDAIAVGNYEFDDDDEGLQTDEDMQEEETAAKETPRSEYARLERTRAEQEKIMWEKRQEYLKK